MENQFVPYDLALKLKELGFDEDCLATIHSKTKKIIPIYGVYKESPRYEDFWIKAPLWQQAGNFLYICSNKKINVSINGSDTYEELCEKFEKAISNFRDLQNNKSKK